MTYSDNEWMRAMIFFLGYQILFSIIDLPFTLYNTFVVERKFGFNKMTIPLFIRDTIIGAFISVVILGIIFFVLTFLIDEAGSLWWFYSALFISAFSFIMSYLYPTFIAPLFNKFKTLENDNLKASIMEMSKKADFPLVNIFQMDASKRSTHSNAYFTGFGKKKRIVLFDTLIEKHSPDEIVSILAHEIGHFKLGHIKIMMAVSVISIFTIFYICGQLINQPFIYNSLGFEQSIFIGLFIISLILSPAGFILKPISSLFSRKHEFEADAFAIKQTEDAELMKNTLIKLHGDNLSNPLPHDILVFFHYSHPPLLQRIERIS